MKTKFLPILMLLLTVVGLSSAKAQSVIYSWDDGDESGGTATSTDAANIGFNSSGTYGYTTLRLNGKKDYSTDYVTITLDKALAGGEKISVTAFRSKNDVDKQSGFKAKFDKGGEVSSSTGLEFVNIDQSDASAEDSNRGTEPNTCEFTVPAEAAGSTVITMTRSHTQTNLYIDKLVITTSEGGDEPVEPVVTIAKPTFEVNGVKYESGATVEGLKTGQQVTINVEDGMYIYTNWSSKTGGKKETYYVADRMKGQNSYGASTTSGGQRVLYAVAGDKDDATGNSSDLAYIVFTGVVASDPVFSPTAGEVEAGTVVTITKGCKDDKVFYTTDGSEPTAESTAYTNEGIKVEEGVTIKAIAFDKNGEYGSATVSATYTIPAPAVVIPTPTFTPESGSTIAFGGEVTINYDQAYTLYYTTDGSDPKTSDTVQPGFNNPETIIAENAGTLTIKAFLSNKDGESEVVTATYTVEGKPIVVGAPTFDPAPGAVEKGTQVHIIFGENATSVSFTTDGTDPLLGDVYTSSKQIDNIAPIIINEETTIKAICRTNEGGKTYSSEVVTVTYTVKEPEVLPETNVTIVDGSLPATFDSWNVSFLIQKTDTKAGDKFTFITQPVEVEGWQWGPQILPKNNADWSDLTNSLIPDAEGNCTLTLTKEMADIINANGGLRIQGMGIKVLAVQFEAGPDEPVTIPDPEPLPDNAVDLIDRFTGNWNNAESNTHNANKTITYNGVAWGGLSAWLVENDKPVDWSEYEKLVFVFGGPTPVAVQGFVQTDEDIKFWGNAGITRLECPFDGKDVSAVKQVALQLSDVASIFVTNIYLVKKEIVEPTPEFALTFDPKDGTEVEVDDQITLTFDEEAFLLYYTTDGSDPKAPTSNVISAWGNEEKVTVKGEGNFVIKAYLENRKTDAQSEVFTATYPIKAVAPFELTFDPKDGTEMEVDDEITLTFDEEAFLLYYTIDGSDPKAPTSNVISAWGNGEKVTVKGEGNFVIRAYLENRKTDAQSEVFTATYPIKASEPIEPEVATIETKANGYGTFCYDKDLDFSASNAKAYIGRLDGNKIYLTEIQQVPAGTGILVQSGATDCTVPVMEGAVPVNSKNDFIGVLEDTEVAYGTVSILSVVNGEEGFYKFLGTTIPANRAYFPAVAAGSAQAKLSLIFEDADGIGQIVSNAIVNGDAHNLNGQRVKSNYKGVVIVNGKKYFKK